MDTGDYLRALIFQALLGFKTALPVENLVDISHNFYGYRRYAVVSTRFKQGFAQGYPHSIEYLYGT